MSSKTQIVNVALSRIGVSQQLNNVETETSKAAVQSNLIWDGDVRFVLRAFPWPWATAYVELALVGGSSSEMVNHDWQYAYRYPSDCVFARRIVVAGGGGRNNPKPPPFRIGRDSQGRLIYTNQPEAVLEYTLLIEDPEEFDPLMESALAWKIGSGLAPSLSRIEGMGEKCLAMMNAETPISQSRALNEGQQEEPIESEFVRSRE